MADFHKFNNLDLKLADKIQNQIVERLLLPSVPTKVIINFYI